MTSVVLIERVGTVTCRALDLHELDNDEAWLAYQRLRHDVYVHVLKSFRASECPDGIEVDTFDDWSRHVLCVANLPGPCHIDPRVRPQSLGDEMVIGCARIVLAEDGHSSHPLISEGSEGFGDGPLAIPLHCPITGDAVRRAQVCEFSRWIGGARPHPDGGTLLAGSFAFRAATVLARQRGLQWMLTAQNHRSCKRQRDNGYPWHQLGENYNYHNTHAVAAWTDLRNADETCIPLWLSIDGNPVSVESAREGG